MGLGFLKGPLLPAEIANAACEDTPARQQREHQQTKGSAVRQQAYRKLGQDNKARQAERNGQKQALDRRICQYSHHPALPHYIPLIAHAPDGHDLLRAARVVLHLFPEPADVDGQCVIVDIIALAVPQLV